MKKFLIAILPAAAALVIGMLIGGFLLPGDEQQREITRAK